MNFEEALEALKAGEKVTREGWHVQDILYLERWEDEGTPAFQPCFVILTPEGHYQPGWLVSQADMLAEDWVQVDE